MNYKNKITENNLGIFFFIIGLIYLIITTYIGLTQVSIWYDEIFSVQMAVYPLDYLINTGINDVHPLLYYGIFKCFVFLFNVFNYTDYIVIGKIVSLIPMYLLWIFSLKKKKKLFGSLTAGIFALCISSMPQLMFFAVELRMYSWALLFVTISFVYFVYMIKNPNWKNFFLLTFFTICSAYTHYFAALASFSIYLVFLIYIIKNKRELLKKWILSVIISILCYLPWLPVVWNQFTSVKSDYWIKPITLQTLKTYFYYILSPPTDFYPDQLVLNHNIIGILLFLSFIILIVISLRNDNDKKCWILSLSSFILVPSIGLFISWTITPILFIRYFIPILGLLWLSFSILLANAYIKKPVFYIILLLILVVGIICAFNFIVAESNDHQRALDDQHNVEEILGNNNIIISDRKNTHSRLSLFYVKNNDYYYSESNIANYTHDLLNSGPVREKINNGSRVFFLDHYDSNVTDLKNLSINLVNVSCENNSNIYGNTVKIYEIDKNQTFNIYEIII